MRLSRVTATRKRIQIGSAGLAAVSLGFLPGTLKAAAPAPAAGDLSAIVELVGAIVGAAGALEDVLLFLVLICVLGIVAVMLHLWHQRDAVTLSLVMLLMVAVGVAAFLTEDAREMLESAEDSRLFLPLDKPRDLGPFEFKLIDVDTLKTKIEDGERPPWKFNATFKEEALREFLRLGRSRLEQDFVVDDEDVARWPAYEEIQAVQTSGDPATWRALMDRMEVDVTNQQTKRKAELKDAFSKWPLVRLRIQEGGRGVLDRYFPDQSSFRIEDRDGRVFKVSIETVFNGDRDLGEAEACALRIERSDP